MKRQPRGTGPRWGAQWADPAMADAYDARHPYDDEIFEVLADLAGPPGAPVVELGAGTGRLTFGLADRVGAVDAIEPSAAMVGVARATRDHPDVRWITSTFEAADVEGPYRLAVGGECVHWLDWDVAFDKLVAVLEPGAPLALVGLADTGPAPWHDAMMRLIVEYSVNDEFEPYSLVPALVAAGRFEEVGRHRTPVTTIREPVSTAVRRLHSCNGLGPTSLGDRCAEFDARMTDALLAHTVDGLLTTAVRSQVVWGRPLPTR